jgi:hypothetical protein
VILHYGLASLGLKRVLVPPAAIRPEFLEIDEPALRLPGGNSRPPANWYPGNPQPVFDRRPLGECGRLALKLKPHGRRGHEPKILGLREKPENLVDRRIEHRSHAKLVRWPAPLKVIAPGAYGSLAGVSQGGNLDVAFPENVSQRLIEPGELIGEPELAQALRIDSLAA